VTPRPRSRIALVATAAIVVAVMIASVASAEIECSTTEIGIDCEATGTSTSSSTTSLPPLRYLATTTDPVLGECWYWSRYPPGLDTWDPYYDAQVLTTKWLLPECPDEPGSTSTSLVSTAWSVFRSFALGAPIFALRPEIGITNLPTLVTIARPSPFHHAETLPDGTVLEVSADVETVWVDWGDGTPPQAYPAATAFSEGARHPFALKTCPADYRTGDPSGWRCHPTLEAYPVTVTFSWVGRHRSDGTWIRLGTIDRRATRYHDVDEVVGVLVAP
jgi:hypothetical protein